MRASVFKIISILEDMGHDIIPKNLLNKGKTHYKIQTQAEKEKSQEKIKKQKKQSDIVILEVSNNSIGIGQELNFALSINKPVIALYKEGLKPHILNEGIDSLLILTPYDDRDLEEVTKQNNVSKAHFFRDLLLKHKQKSTNQPTATKKLQT